MPTRFLKQILFGASVIAGTSTAAFAAPTNSSMITGVISDAVTSPLVRDVPGALHTSTDLGRLGGSTMLPDVLLTLKRPPQQQAALDALARAQMTRGSASYHRWLTPDQLGAYGPSQADITAVSRWLVSHGLTVTSVAPSGMTIHFGGDSAHVEAAFHTQIHRVQRAGEIHIANTAAPSIPAAFSAVVEGVTLSNFAPKPQMRRVGKQLTANTSYGTFYAETPGDFATIYNTNPLLNGTSYAGKVTGKGATVAVVEQTLINPADWQTFRSTFGLNKFAGTLTLVHPNSCTSPGYTPDEGEAALDAEWASAAAPAANIIEASCAGKPPFNFGVYTALENLVEHPTPATIFSISYGGPETSNGFGFQAAWSNLTEEGSVEGKSIFVSSGDSGSSADRNQIANNGTEVNGLSDTYFVTSVGGTDFADSALGQNSTYWRASNSPTLESAVSYIPEIPWDGSCASSILASFLGVTPQQLCNINPQPAFVAPGVGGTGGQSLYYTKPRWQSLGIPGMPNDGVRDQPDVSLFSSVGPWGHFLVFCMSDANEGGAPCNYSGDNIFKNAAGGTSFAAPTFAGIAALIAQYNNPNPRAAAPGLGNVDPGMYGLAKAQFATPLGLKPCDSLLGNKISKACIFNVITAGDNAEPCHAGTVDCLTTKDSTNGIGILGAKLNGKTVNAFPAGLGYSLATGLGSVNVTNLVYGYYSSY